MFAGSQNKKAVESNKYFKAQYIPRNRTNRPHVRKKSSRHRNSWPRDNCILKLGSKHWHETKRARRKRCINQISKFLKKSSQWELVRQYNDRGDNPTKPTMSAARGISHLANITSNQKTYEKQTLSDVDVMDIFKSVGVIFDPEVCPVDFRTVSTFNETP